MNARMTLTAAESAYSEAKMQDNGSTMAARRMRFAARELCNAWEAECINRVGSMQKFSDDVGVRAMSFGIIPTR